MTLENGASPTALRRSLVPGQGAVTGSILPWNSLVGRIAIVKIKTEAAAGDARPMEWDLAIMAMGQPG